MLIASETHPFDQTSLIYGDHILQQNYGRSCFRNITVRRIVFLFGMPQLTTACRVTIDFASVISEKECATSLHRFMFKLRKFNLSLVFVLSRVEAG
jgi:hypothetical protein